MPASNDQISGVYRFPSPTTDNPQNYEMLTITASYPASPTGVIAVTGTWANRVMTNTLVQPPKAFIIQPAFAVTGFVMTMAGPIPPGPDPSRFLWVLSGMGSVLDPNGGGQGIAVSRTALTSLLAYCAKPANPSSKTGTLTSMITSAQDTAGHGEDCYNSRGVWTRVS